MITSEGNKSSTNSMVVKADTLSNVLKRWSLGLGILFISWNAPALAQSVTTDTSTVNTVVTGSGPFIITEGTIRADRNNATLFHSFENFSPAAANVLFDLRDSQNTVNTSLVNTIIGRVTGNTTSFINGDLAILQDTGTPAPDLFLINPNGITFGADASLSLPGSFLASTAESIVFNNNGLEFKSNNSTGAPLLAISTPIGLQFGSGSGAIDVQSTSLVVPAQHTLSLTGANINIMSSILETAQGRIELGSVASPGQVDLIPNSDGFALEYENINTFGDISISQSSDIIVSGQGAGNIHLQGRTVSLSATNLFANTLGTQSGGSIRVIASEAIDIDDFSEILVQISGTATGQGADVSAVAPNLRIADGSFIYLTTSRNTDIGNITIDANSTVLQDAIVFNLVEPGATGDAGEITVNTDELWLIDASQIGSNTLGAGNTSNITVNATSLIDASGETPDGFFTSLITSVPLAGGTGNGGDIVVNVGKLRLRDGAQIFAGTFGEGDAGSIDVRASTIELVGSSPTFGFESSILASSSQAIPGVTVGTGNALLRGNSGNIDISTETLQLLDGGSISSATGGFGDAANIFIQANDVDIREFSSITSSTTSLIGGNSGQIQLNVDRVSIQNGGQVIASTFGSGNGGSIEIQANQVDLRGSSANENFVSRITTSSTGSGNAGSVQINSNGITVAERGEISVNATVFGNAGNLAIETDILRLANEGRLQAEAANGDQGNLFLSIRDLLIMRNNSLISTNASNQASGGNITIDAPIILGLENSDITANAIQGRGGNINITTQGIIGLAFRGQITPESDITASSQFGISGTVQINDFGVVLGDNLVELSDILADSSNRISQGCSSNNGSRFVATGRGGIPINPTQIITHNNVWVDIRNLSAVGDTSVSLISPLTSTPPSKIIEATAWQFNPGGYVELIASEVSQPELIAYATCGGSNAAS